MVSDFLREVIILKILCLIDKSGTALDRLAQGVSKYHDNLDYKVLAVHPKRPDPQQLADFEREAKDADIIDAQYYRTLYKLRELYPWLKDKKTILTHNNPYAIEEQEWNDVDMNVGNNSYITERLGQITEKPVEYIPLTVDTDFWTFNPDWEANKNVIMVANRIESKKGILPVAIACADLNLHFILVGAISNMDYFQSIIATGNVEFHEQISDEELKQLYYKSTIHVCNSVDKFESGTLPILESMLCGVPVLTREIGHVPELYNGENMYILDGVSEDVEGIKDKLLEMISDKKRLSETRDKAWQTAKTRSNERRAYMYQKLYRQVLSDETSVSVVVPIYDKPEIIKKCLNAIAEQTHKNIEVIVADDNPGVYGETGNRELVEDFAKYVNIPVRYLLTGYQTDLGDEDYGLARARNEATIEATGEVIVYVDQRMVLESTAISEFLKYLKPKVWLYGNKNSGKTNFVENVSCIYRQDVIDFGLFNERVTAYGGLSQETRNRFKNQGGKTEYVESAKATPTGKSSNRNRKRADIIRMKNLLWKINL
jgi:glycosyltransferase involved in cell wall biosynthesis